MPQKKVRTLYKLIRSSFLENKAAERLSGVYKKVKTSSSSFAKQKVSLEN